MVKAKKENKNIQQEWFSTSWVERNKWKLLYSWRFSHYSVPIHWLVHGHMTSNNETVSKCHERATLRKLWHQMGNSSLLCAKWWPPLQVIAGISAWFSNAAFVLFCCITNHLMTGLLGNSEFCFPRISMFLSTSSRETKFTVPLETSH